MTTRAATDWITVSDPRATSDVSVSLLEDGAVGMVRLSAPPNNFLNTFTVRGLVDAFGWLSSNTDARAAVLVSDGKHFCAGRDFASHRDPEDTSAAVYEAAQGLVDVDIPWVAALHGGAIGAGAGLAACADFRVATEDSYFHCNFVRLGLYPGFGLTATLPAIVGPQHAYEIFLAGRRVSASDAQAIGLVDRTVPVSEVCDAAVDVAKEMAALPPLAVRAIRDTMRVGAPAFRAATQIESVEQARLAQTDDFREAAAAARERRDGRFLGR